MNAAPAVASDRLRIAIVHASDLGGGAERSVVGLHRGLRELGHESTLFVGEQRTLEPGVEAIPYVRGVPGSRRVARALERSFGWQDIYNPSFRALARRLRGGFDIVHFNSLWGSGGYADLGALPRITAHMPGIITMRENWLITGHCACFDACPRWRNGCGQCPDLDRVPRLPRDGTAFNWRRKERLLQRSHLHVVAVSDWLKARAQESPILQGKPVSRIYNGIDLNIFAPALGDDRWRLRRNLGIADEDVVVLLAGQAVNGLNNGDAPRHASAILDIPPGSRRLRPLLVGRRDGPTAIGTLAGSISLPYQESLEAMADCYRMADLTLVTSEAEAFGRIAAESQACATPVVTFDTGALPEIVSDGEGGFVLRRGDVAGAQEAVNRLARDASLRTEMGRRGRLFVSERFDAAHIARSYVELYRRACDRFADDASPAALHASRRH